MRWFENFRADWVAEMVRIYGYINREQVIRKFGVSPAQASRDLQNALARYPDMMTYNKHSKRYELAEDWQPSGWQTSTIDDRGVHQIRMKPNGDTERRVIDQPRIMKG